VGVVELVKRAQVVIVLKAVVKPWSCGWCATSAVVWYRYVIIECRRSKDADVDVDATEASTERSACM